ncbi:MAG: hypothetical protein RID25_13850 [Cyclobacteriaceae bacterium]
MMKEKQKSIKRFPYWGWLAISLIVVFWYINWGFDGLRTHWAFFPLWLGYILLMDALTYFRKGNSLLSRSFSGFIFLFIVSAPAWWLFEAINEVTQFWQYSDRERFTDLEYAMYATLSFSTVIPAMFTTAELVGTFAAFQKEMKGPKIGGSLQERLVLLSLGMLMLACVFVFPEYSSAFIWMSIYLILDPVNHFLGNRTVIRHTATGNWTPVLVLWAASLICGFFWEFWNYYSLPKWYYTVPFVDFWYVFEMPLLGYLGYLPFALELFALYHLITGLMGKWEDYVNV